MLFELTFGSFLVYSPRGSTEISRATKRIGIGIKQDGPSSIPGERMIEYAVRRMNEELAGSARDLGPLLGPAFTAVPVPSCRLLRPDSLWVPRRICEALLAKRMVGRVSPLLQRTKAIEKSATSQSRPNVRAHLESLRTTASAGLTSERFLLVDDVVTKGATLSACALTLLEAFPNSTVAALAILRTKGLVAEVESIVEPCLGRITWNEKTNELWREP